MAACLLSYKDEDTEGKEFMALRQALTKWLRGLFSLPINVPGTGESTSQLLGLLVGRGILGLPALHTPILF